MLDELPRRFVITTSQSNSWPWPPRISTTALESITLIHRSPIFIGTLLSSEDPPPRAIRMGFPRCRSLAVVSIRKISPMVPPRACHEVILNKISVQGWYTNYVSTTNNGICGQARNGAWQLIIGALPNAQRHHPDLTNCEDALQDHLRFDAALSARCGCSGAPGARIH